MDAIISMGNICLLIKRSLGSLFRINYKIIKFTMESLLRLKEVSFMMLRKVGYIFLEKDTNKDFLQYRMAAQ